MTWAQFPYFAIAASLLWGAGAYVAWRERSAKLTYLLTLGGLVVFFTFRGCLKIKFNLGSQP